MQRLHLEPATGGAILTVAPSRRLPSLLRPREAAGAIPPSGLVILGMLAVQLGAALAKNLFHSLGPGGTVFLRIFFAAVVLLALWRPSLRGQTAADLWAMILFGLTIAAMNAAFYAAIARLPLGIAVTLEFVGPLGVAIAGSRRRLDLLWGLLAACGVVMLMPISGAVDSLGVLFALAAGGCWAAYILLNIRVGRAFPGATGLALAMGIAAVAALPLGLVGSSVAGLLDPGVLLLGAGVALLSTVVPFSLEHTALKRLPARAFGVLMSLEPGIASLVGFVLLRESLGPRGVLALVCVTMATLGSARFGTPASGA